MNATRIQSGFRFGLRLNLRSNSVISIHSCLESAAQGIEQGLHINYNFIANCPTIAHQPGFIGILRFNTFLGTNRLHVASAAIGDLVHHGGQLVMVNL